MTDGEIPSAHPKDRPLRPSVEGVTPIAKAVAPPAPAKLAHALQIAESLGR